MNFEALKIRAKRSDTGEPVEGFLVPVCPDATMVYTGDWASTKGGIPTQICHRIDPDTVLRCSGIPATDGKMIFEGDKVELRRMAPSLGNWSPPPVSGVVVFEEGCWSVDTGSELIFMFQEIDRWKIAGDVLDPETEDGPG